MNSEVKTPVIYPREGVCRECGKSMILGWYNPWEPSPGREPVYRHPVNGCEFSGKMLKPVGMFAGVLEE
jgi:hypothetical protein